MTTTPTHPTTRPAWLKSELLTGLMRLVALSLDRTPPMDTIELTAEVWFDAMCKRRTWQREVDVPRIRRAFDALAINATQWPAPAQFLAAIPPPEREYFTVLGTDRFVGKRSITEKTLAVIADLRAKLGIGA